MCLRVGSLCRRGVRAAAVLRAARGLRGFARAACVTGLRRRLLAVAGPLLRAACVARHRAGVRIPLRRSGAILLFGARLVGIVRGTRGVNAVVGGDDVGGASGHGDGRALEALVALRHVDGAVNDDEVGVGVHAVVAGGEGPGAAAHGEVALGLKRVHGRRGAHRAGDEREVVLRDDAVAAGAAHRERAGAVDGEVVVRPYRAIKVMVVGLDVLAAGANRVRRAIGQREEDLVRVAHVERRRAAGAYAGAAQHELHLLAVGVDDELAVGEAAADDVGAGLRDGDRRAVDLNALARGSRPVVSERDRNRLGLVIARVLVAVGEQRRQVDVARRPGHALALLRLGLGARVRAGKRRTAREGSGGEQSRERERGEPSRRGEPWLGVLCAVRCDRAGRGARKQSSVRAHLEPPPYARVRPRGCRCSSAPRRSGPSCWRSAAG